MEIFLKSIALGVPALVIAFLILLMIDNFTYTIFNWGIVNSSGYQRAIYILVFFLLLFFLYPRIGKTLSWMNRRMRRVSWSRFVLPFLLSFILLSILLSVKWPETSGFLISSLIPAGGNELPNIIMITGDGINASQTSAYGYEIDTTPNMRALAETSLVAENAFTNAGNTAGALVAIYTGKYPSTTRVIYTPDILRGEDSYQHLPGILKGLGYYSVEYAALRYADAFELNLISGFDVVNGRTVQNNVLFTKLNELFKTNEAYLFYEISNRLTERLAHIFFISNMTNNQGLAQGQQLTFDDQSKIDTVLEIVEESDRPLFAHIHWMGTHAARFTPEVEPDPTINDKNISVFDKSIGQLIHSLERMGKMDNTILIAGSDHARMYYTTKRMPLIIHFPNGAYAKKVKSNVQLMDISPTILDYLGIEKPAWMKGDSLLGDEPGNRILYGFGVPNEIRNTGSVPKDYMKPPFYQFGFISVVYCDAWYRYRYSTQQLETGKVEGHTAPCSSDLMPSNQEVMGWMRDHLQENNFDVSSIKQ